MQCILTVYFKLLDKPSNTLYIQSIHYHIIYSSLGGPANIVKLTRSMVHVTYEHSEINQIYGTCNLRWILNAECQFEEIYGLFSMSFHIVAYELYKPKISRTDRIFKLP